MEHFLSLRELSFSYKLPALIEFLRLFLTLCSQHQHLLQAAEEPFNGLLIVSSYQLIDYSALVKEVECRYLFQL